MKTKDIDLKTLYSLKQRLSSISENIPDLEMFLSKLNSKLTRNEAALVLSLLVVHALEMNRTEGKFALLLAGESLTKFTIQRGEEIQAYAEFATDFQSSEVLVSLIYTILDSARGSNTNRKDVIAFRAIAEVLEDFGADRPTLVILITSNLSDDSEDISPFIRAIARNERYHLDVFGVGTEFNIQVAEKKLVDIDATFYPVTRLSGYVFDKYLLTAIEQLFSKS